MRGEFGRSEAKKEAGASSTRFSGTTGFGKSFMYQSYSAAKCVIDAVTPTVTVVMLLRSIAEEQVRNNEFDLAAA